ncbi:MAG: NADH:ubiquinone reductase (Na(+)-transporting) subunit C [Prevotellaceae bacterium]|jgi:Na+-transporting NADH:ubiquinone oxidoreductase subunit C|nr:NADH:ubiquinone reductase (Na(+)-transporting) subunit C [Prevotellaceae bacterium]
MNKESNKYIFLYSIALVVLVAAVLAVASITLKPFQQKNIEVEKKQSILHSVQKAADVKNAKNKTLYVEKEYAKYITSSFVVSTQGTKVAGDAFEISLEEEFSKPLAKRRLPVFVCTEDDGSKKYILPVRGVGLWGPLWGYIALQNDYSTIYGVVFDHKGETPGLGAEISTPKFQEQFAGKQIFEGTTFTSILVAKGGGTQGKPHEVDAISGGTITSKGLEEMLSNSLSAYQNFFKEEKQKQEKAAAAVAEKEEGKKVEKKKEAQPAPKPAPKPVVVDTAASAPAAEVAQPEAAPVAADSSTN